MLHGVGSAALQEPLPGELSVLPAAELSGQFKLRFSARGVYIFLLFRTEPSLSLTVMTFSGDPSFVIFLNNISNCDLYYSIVSFLD